MTTISLWIQESHWTPSTRNMPETAWKQIILNFCKPEIKKILKVEQKYPKHIEKQRWQPSFHQTQCKCENSGVISQSTKRKTNKQTNLRSMPSKISFKICGKIDQFRLTKVQIIHHQQTHIKRSVKGSPSKIRDKIPDGNLDLHKGMKSKIFFKR